MSRLEIGTAVVLGGFPALIVERHDYPLESLYRVKTQDGILNWEYPNVRREEFSLMRHYSIRDEYAPLFGRQRLTLWAGAYASQLEGSAWELPGHNGYVVTLYGGERVRVECEAPRTDDNYRRVDSAICAAITAALGEDD